MATKKPSSSMDSYDREYRAQDDLRTIQRAQEVLADKQRLRAAQAQAKKQVSALSRVGKLSGRKI